eukprot:g17358.t1
MDSTGGREKSMPSPPTANPSLSWPFPRNEFDPSATICKRQLSPNDGHAVENRHQPWQENDGPQRSESIAAAGSSGTDSLMSYTSVDHGINIACDINSNNSSVGNIANDICGTTSFNTNNSNNRHTVNVHASNNRSGTATNKATALTSATTYADSAFPRLQGGNAANTEHKNRAGISINYDNLSSAELEMTPQRPQIPAPNPALSTFQPQSRPLPKGPEVPLSPPPAYDEKIPAPNPALSTPQPQSRQLPEGPKVLLSPPPAYDDRV